jgi:uncharacterized protein YdiU (UPF0061 family)
MQLDINNSFIEELPADEVTDNHVRQVFKSAFSYVNPIKPKQPKLLHVSPEMLNAVGFNLEDANSKQFLEVFSGTSIYKNTQPYAMAYAGHQFGSWAGQLGDGRAINLFEVLHNRQRWALQLKGAGKTPYSRQGDGLAVLRSSIREYLCSEAMHHLGITTTRALCLMETGDDVLRDMLYDGNANYEKGAIVCRVAPSFIRFGNFELFAARQDYQNLKKLTDYTIKHFYLHLGQPSKDTYIELFKEVTERTLKMIIDWQRVGFVHGVMNTDNMSILGLTIDYGPYGWLEGFEYNWTPNTTDAQNKRYRYGNQPNIALWNLLQLANALYPLVEEAEPFERILNQYKIDFEVQYLNMMRGKIGLVQQLETDADLIARLEALLLKHETDMTIFFRKLCDYQKGMSKEGFDLISEAFYNAEDLPETLKMAWLKWFEDYNQRLQTETANDSQRFEAMKRVNPKYVLRNYMAQLAIDNANKGNYGLIDELFQLLKNPYNDQPENEKWFARRPEWARHKVGCSMLSCSS